MRPRTLRDAKAIAERVTDPRAKHLAHLAQQPSVVMTQRDLDALLHGAVAIDELARLHRSEDDTRERPL